MFRMLFHDRSNLLDLYNAVNDTHYTNADEFEIVTLENAVYMNMKNDLAFLVDFHLNLYEHQSTFNPNMPLRNLFYVSEEYQRFVKNRTIYSTYRIQLPTPRFLVFYNGTDLKEERKILKLSDSYFNHYLEPELELKVTMLNINAGHNHKLLEQCIVLKEYMQYVEKVRTYTVMMGLQEAVERAVTECISEGILSEFLTRNRAEAISVSIFEYNEEREKALMRQEEFEAGEERFAILSKKLLEENLVSELEKAISDKAYRNELYKKYQL